ncbi:MAG: hypothetical protein FJ275_02760 [Planctomycetes bacterium]|nr:hypothetical protein [Planctomycetota bacterium]
MDTKQNLANLIDAYAAAKGTNNETLIRLSVAQLQDFLAHHDVVPLGDVNEQVQDTEGAGVAG